MATEEEHTPTKPIRRNKGEEERPQNSADAGIQASAPLYSPLKPVFKSLASPQLLWLPRLPNEDSPLMISKFQPSQAPPTLPINALPPAAESPPMGLNFSTTSALGSNFPYIRRSVTPTKATTTSIPPLWNAKNNRNGPFKAIFGGSLGAPLKRTTTTAAAAAVPPPPPPSLPAPQLPPPLHHQASFNFPAAQVEQNHIVDSKNAVAGGSGGSAERITTSGGDGAAAKSARPEHRRRKKPRVHTDTDDIDLQKYNEPSSTSDEGSHGHHQQQQQQQQQQRSPDGKKVRWETGP